MNFPPQNLSSAQEKGAAGGSSTTESTEGNLIEVARRVDGGRAAWMTLFGAWLAIAATFGYTYSFGIYQDLYTRSHAASATRVSWIGATQVFLFIATGLPAGKLYDKGHFRVVVALGSVIYVFSLMMLSIAHTDKYYQLFLSQGVGMGIGGGMVYVPALAVQAEHWRNRRTLAMGIASCGVPVGGTFFPIMLNQLLHHSVSFGWSVRASAFLVLGMLVVANFCMTAYPRKSANTSEQPTKLKDLITDAPYMCLAIGGIFIQWGLYFPYFYMQLYTILHGMDPTFAFYTLTIMNGAGIPGRILPNLLAETYGPVNMIAVASIGCAILAWSFFAVKSVGGVVAFAIIYGFFAGAWFALLSPVLSKMSKNEKELGIRMGFAFALGSIGALTGTPIDGALLGSTFPWSKPIAFSAVRTSRIVPFKFPKLMPGACRQ
ncbi:MFS general substrate transporter [Auriscalpium vulgare]|uniref:MFS general substrate transporter n=1 Tax=Auriscalpium vulgare TaxID=40419 RepID=A0ACB8RSM4_9AGAM|nr:MFS general substrate transporter [Auriscalpium vulgare]